MPDITMLSDRRERRFLAAIPPALAAMGGGSKALGALYAGGAISGLASIPMMFGAGMPSEEEQERMLRRQLEIQDEFEQQRAMRAGDGDLAGLVGGGRAPTISELMFEEQMTSDLADIAKSLKRGREGARLSPELQELLAGEYSRIASLQQSRMLTPMELLARLEAVRG